PIAKEIAPLKPLNIQRLPSNQIILVKSEITKYHPSERTNYEEYSRFFEKFNDKENITNISEYERTGRFLNEPYEGYSKDFTKRSDEAYKILRKSYNKTHESYIKNYVRRVFSFASSTERRKGESFLKKLKRRKLHMPLDEALENMRRRCI